MPVSRSTMTTGTVNLNCEGEILFAYSYGGLEDYTFTNSIAATSAWLDAVKERKAVVCETNNTFWMDFELNSQLVFGELYENDREVDPYLLFARRYCYKRFLETFCGYFGMTEVFGFLYRMFSHRHKEPPDEYDKSYAKFVDSLLNDVRFIVCLKRRESMPIVRDMENDQMAKHVAVAPTETASGQTPTRANVDGMSLGLQHEVPIDRPRSGKTLTQLISPFHNKSAYALTHQELDMSSEDEYPTHSRTEFSTSTPLKSKSNMTNLDFFTNSPAAAEAAPDASLQDNLESSTTELASAGYNNSILETTVTPLKRNQLGSSTVKRNIRFDDKRDDYSSPFDQMPIVMLYDSDNNTEKVLGYEPESVKQSYIKQSGFSETFVLIGLFDTPATPNDGTVIEITYSVQEYKHVMTFNVISVFNKHLETYGDRGLVRFELVEFVGAIRSLDSNARLVDAERLDLYSFEIDVDSLHKDSFLKGKRKMFMRFGKTRI